MEPKPYIKTRFRVVPSKRSDADHWSGGEPQHKNAICPVCKIPLLLLWDINCKDPRFGRRKFWILERLPLYYCWCCVNDISYQLTDGDRIRIHPPKRRNETSFPYEPYPESFERRALTFDDGFPDKIRRLCVRLLSDFEFEPSMQEKKTLREFFGHSVIHGLELTHHQFGGRPMDSYWADEVFCCPNSACSGRITDRIRGRKRPMKFLAGILNDPWGGLPMVEPANDETKDNWNNYVHVQFHICDLCLTTTGANRCD